MRSNAMNQMEPRLPAASSRRPPASGRPARNRRSAIALFGCLAGMASGCGVVDSVAYETCDRSAGSNKPVRYAEGTVKQGIYATSEPNGELLYFPGGMRYALEHGLGARPDWWQIYLSFNRYGTEKGTLAQAAGNQAEVL